MGRSCRRSLQGDDELSRRVHALLLAHAQPDSRLEHVAIDFPLTLDLPITEMSGTQIGPYKLLQQLGEGGMGVVYVAEQKEPVNGASRSRSLSQAWTRGR